jgi:hypothetical protein
MKYTGAVVYVVTTATTDISSWGARHPFLFPALLPVAFFNSELSQLQPRTHITKGKLWVFSIGECTGHTQKNGAVSKEFTIHTAPFFCVCPVYNYSDLTSVSYLFSHSHFMCTRGIR